MAQIKKYYHKLPFWFKLWWAKQLLYMFKGFGSTFVNDIVLYTKITEMINELELWVTTKGRPSIPAYKGILLDEAAKYGKSFEYQTAKVEVKEVGVKYDYSQCGNSRLADLYWQAEAIAARIKELETYHKGLPASGIEVLDPFSGELEKHYPPAKTSNIKS